MISLGYKSCLLLLLIVTCTEGWVAPNCGQFHRWTHQRTKGSTDSVSTDAIVRIFELVENSVGKDKTAPLPRAVLDARDTLMQRDSFKMAFEKRRDFIRASFCEGDPKASEMTRRLEMAHAFLNGFVAHERQKASREKVRVILNEAVKGSGGGLDHLLHELGTRGDLDDDLDDYLSGLIDSERRRLGPPSTSSGGANRDLSGQPNDDGSQEHEVQSALGMQRSQPLLQILDIVCRRVKVERQSLSSDGSPRQTSAPPSASPMKTRMVQVLARAASIASDDERKDYLQSALVDRAFTREFVLFAEDGAEYLIDQVEKNTVPQLAERTSTDMNLLGLEKNGGTNTVSQADVARIRQAGRVKVTAVQARKVFESQLQLSASG